VVGVAGLERHVEDAVAMFRVFFECFEFVGGGSSSFGLNYFDICLV